MGWNHVFIVFHQIDVKQTLYMEPSIFSDGTYVLKTSYYLIIILEKQFWRQKSSSGIFNICLILSKFWGPPLPMTHWKREQLITTWDKLIITWDWTTLAICLFTWSDYYIPQMHLHFIRLTTSEYSQAIITHLSCTVWLRLW